MDKQTICSGCLSKINGEQICPICGNDNAVNNEPLYLRTFSMLQNRYIIGRTIHTNGEHALYIGFDVVTKTKVFVKEYVPTVLCRRLEDGSLAMLSGKEALYKSMMADFCDLHKKLSSVKNDVVQPIDEIFGANNTVYVIAPWKKSVSLRAYMDASGKGLNWEDVLTLFEPFMRSMLDLHAAGICHRGISPDTIWMDKSGRLFLNGFATPSTRILKSDMDAELFDGFSAPEQYSLKSWQGTWTDVYSLAAVMYYCLTYVTPPHAIERPKRDTLVPCHEINQTVSKVISTALSRALIPYTESRTQTISSFMFALDESLQPTKTKSNSSKSDSKKSPLPFSNQGNRRFPYMLVSLLVTVVLMTTGGLFWISQNYQDEWADFWGVNRSHTANTTPTQVVMEDYTGLKYSEVSLNTRFEVPVKVENVYDEEIEAGKIISQSPQATTPLDQVTEVVFFVSKGSRYVQVPNILPCTRSEAIRLLNDAGITDYTFTPVEKEGYSSGQVISCMPGVGTKISRENGHVDILYQK